MKAGLKNLIEKSIILKRTYFNTFDVHIVGIQKGIPTQFAQVTILTFFPPSIVSVIILKNINTKKEICVCVYLHTHDDGKQERFVYKESGDLSGGMQHNTEPNKNAKELKALMTLFDDAIDESELKKRLEENNGNVVLVIEQLTTKLMHQEIKESEEKEHSKEIEKKTEKVKKDEDNENVGEIKPGINLQGYCNNEKCLASKGRLLVWISFGFIEISLTPDKTVFECPNCAGKTVTTVIKAMFYNSDHSIHAIGD
ncbi:hypothetical protein RFI_22241, partial [Reticulomyxa filosa]